MISSKRTVLGLVSILALSACSDQTGFKSSNVTATASQSNLPFMQARVSMSISQASTEIYNENTPNSSLVLKAGESYKLKLNAQNAPLGSTYQMVLTNISQVNPTALAPIPLNVGDNNFSVDSAGDYAVKLQLQATGYQPQVKTYTAQVLCPNPNFSASSLNPAGLSVSSSGGNNLYNFSAAGVVAGANGSPPYQCAFDLTGVGIVDSGFRDCAQTLTNAYVNYVDVRKVGVVVKDACNNAFTVSADRNLTYSVPAMGAGNVFIFGNTSNATGAANNDARLDDVTYLATNSGGNNIVIPRYDTGVFTIEALQNYGMPSGVKFGMKISLQGFTDTINNSSNSNPSINTSNVSVKQVLYTTDQAGDQAPSVTYVSSSCTLTNLNAKVIFAAGQPCSVGTTGNQNKTTVEVWGHLKCLGMQTGSGATIDFEGDFDGLDLIADSCVGGGGGGGGGIVPVEL